MNLKTNRLELKPISPDSITELTALLTDEQVKKTYMIPDFSTPAEAEALARRLMDLSLRADRYVAGIYRDEKLVGILNETDVEDGRIELGYALLPRYHNRGFCTEALRGAIAWLFDHGFSEVLTGAFAENTASLRVMVKSGMKHLDRREKITYRDQTHECVYYSAVKGEWQ